MLETPHKNADAFNLFCIRMREEEFDRSADQYTSISRWISMIVYFHQSSSPPFFSLMLYPAPDLFVQ